MQKGRDSVGSTGSGKNFRSSNALSMIQKQLTKGGHEAEPTTVAEYRIENERLKTTLMILN